MEDAVHIVPQRRVVRSPRLKTLDSQRGRSH